MQLHFVLTLFTGIRSKIASQRVRNLVFALVLCLLLGGLLLPSLVHAKAAPAGTLQINGLTMIDQRFGWAVSANSPYHVYRTHQGPEHWNDVTPPLITSNPQTTITSSYFPDANRAYLGVLQNQDVSLLSTHNGGKTWQTTPFAIPIITEPVTITQITFLDVQHGWLSFNRAQSQGRFDILLMSTSDGGKTWHTLFDTTQNPSVLPVPFGNSSSFVFHTPHDGWVTGLLPADMVYLYETHDGGKTWKQANIAPIKGNDSVDFTQDYGPYWRNGKTATLYVVYDVTPLLESVDHITTYQTYDGGNSWILEPSSPSTSSQEFFSLSFLNAEQGWSFGFNGQGQYIIHHTSNGGKSWELSHPTGLLQPNLQTPNIGSLSFINARTGWVFIKDIQGNWNLFQTDDGGHTWNALHPVLDA